MALAMLGHISDPGGIRWRDRGLNAKFWRLAEPYYHTGMELSEAVEMLARLNLGLRTRLIEARHQAVLDFCEDALQRGELVILSYRPRNSPIRHAVLVCGIEGRFGGRSFDATARRCCACGRA